MDIPNVVKNSNLYVQLGADPDLLTAVLTLRSVAGTLADTVSRTVPTFTDHTLKHMDALWGVTDKILTKLEVTAMSPGEAFILTCGFYLHDIGMAYAATDEGMARIRSSPPYASFMASAHNTLQADTAFQARALAYAVRTIHAEAAAELATKEVPGTTIYLFDSKSIREAWGDTCGIVAASHHWSLEKIEQTFGSPGNVALPGGHRGDLGYTAALLRLADYAHINRDRACKIERAFRQKIEPKSLVHWFAQENVDGPERDGADLVYRAAKPIADVDAWWLYYEMLKGLDDEIRMVRRYLDRRASSQGRLSLQGVRGVTSPEEAAVFVPTTGFLPIEINLRTGSIERLVELLAGESLYGPDPMAAVRELIQNSRDAVMLKATIASSAFDKSALTIPIRLALKTVGPSPQLEITDPGVGMTRKVMTDYLISIASDYWTSEFNTDFPEARGRGFKPAGRFGIGFLAVFMLGDEVTVESNRSGGERLRLRLRGVGRRGEIRTSPTTSGSGTAVRLDLRKSVVESLRSLDELVRVYAPMLPHSIEIDVDGKQTTIPKGWLQELDTHEFYKWCFGAINILARNKGRRDTKIRDFERLLLEGRHHYGSGPPMEPRKSWTKTWPQFLEDHVRLVASFEGYTLLSLRGLAIQPISTPGFVGVIDLESATPDVSRRIALDANVTDILRRANLGMRPQIVENLNALAGEGLLIDKIEFLASCVQTYGRETIIEASIPWISLLKLPGEIELLSCAALFERLSKSASLFVAYGTGPWTAMKDWVAFDPPPVKGEPAIVIDDTRHDFLAYRSSSEEAIGKLSDLWPRCVDLPLFGTILRLAAEAWQTDLDVLTGQDGWRHTQSKMVGRLSRP